MTKNTLEKKYCPRCDRWYERSNFYTNKAHPDGYAAYCKPCDIAKQKARRGKNKEGYFLAGQKQKRTRNHNITNEEFNIIKTHTEIGYHIISHFIYIIFS